MLAAFPRGNQGKSGENENKTATPQAMDLLVRIAICVCLLLRRNADDNQAGEKKIVKQFGKFLILASVMLMAACSASREQEAKELVSSFYQTHQANRPNGALSLKELITFRHFLSVPLFDLLKDVSVAEEAHLAQTDNQTPPLVDGDLFTTHPKGASTYRVLACEGKEANSTCSVEFIYSDAKLQSPFKSVDRVVLSRDARGWVIDNIEYGGGSANSGVHQGDLQKSLQAILNKNERRIVQ